MKIMSIYQLQIVSKVRNKKPINSGYFLCCLALRVGLVLLGEDLKKRDLNRNETFVIGWCSISLRGYSIH